MRSFFAATAALALTLAGCGGRPAPLERRDGGAARDGAHYDGGFRDGAVHGDAGAKCDDLANRYLAFAASSNYCGAASDCVAHPVDCAIGAYAGVRDCYLYVGRSADTAQLAALAQEWAQSGCPEVLCEQCAPPPSLRCQAGRCVPGAECAPDSCVSGPDPCCGRDCDPGTSQTCNGICPPVPPPDPLCDCAAEGGCGPVWCTSDWGCAPGSRCDPESGICVRVPRCENLPVGCRAVFTHCSCSWACLEGDVEIDDCPATCPDEERLRLSPPRCECGLGGCGMVLCEPNAGDCGFGYLCIEVPGSLSYQVCAECANCRLGGPPR